MEDINSKPPDATSKPERTFTPPDRIKELNDIDASIAQLLYAAGTALQVLGSNSSATTLPSAKAQFLDSITTYFTVLSSIDFRLRRQVYALQEAGLIAEGDTKDAKRGASAAGAGGAASGAVGQLEMSWLNNQGDLVEKDMEREIWKRARDFVEKLVGEVDGRRELQTNGKLESGEGNKEKDEEEIMKDEKDEG